MARTSSRACNDDGGAERAMHEPPCRALMRVAIFRVWVRKRKIRKSPY